MENSSENHVENHVIPGRNGGRLRNGGTNKGGPGRPPDKVRAACRNAFDKRIPILRKLAESDEPAVALKALDMLAKYGLGTTFTPTDTDGQTLRAITVTHQVVDPASGH